MTSVYGVRAIIDPDLPKTGSYPVSITDADFRTAMEALTVVTDTFVFPVSPNSALLRDDTEAEAE